MARDVNAETIKKLKGWEAFVPYPYDDRDTHGRKVEQTSWKKNKKGQNIGTFGGVITIGYGHTGNDIVPSMHLSETEADFLLRKDLDRYEACVEQTIKVALSDNQFGALVSFCYNLGETAFRKTNLVRKLNAGRYDDVPGELLKFVYSNGKRMPGLLNRRNAEIGLWNKGSFVASNFVDAEGKGGVGGGRSGGLMVKAGLLASGAAEAAKTYVADGAEKVVSASQHVDGIKEKLADFSGFPHVETILFGLTVFGLAGAAIGWVIHHQEAKA
jgi:lysozyme